MVSNNHLLNVNKLNQLKNNKMLKYMIQFYLPQKGQFVEMDWKIDNFKYAKVGYILISQLLQTQEGLNYLSKSTSNQFSTTQNSFLQDLKDFLEAYIRANVQSQSNNHNQ